MSQWSSTAPRPPPVLRRGHERAQRVGQHAAARVRRQRAGLVRAPAAVPRLRQGGAQLRQPDALPGDYLHTNMIVEGTTLKELHAFKEKWSTVYSRTVVPFVIAR